MAADTDLIAVQEPRWSAGFRNLLRKENGAWWGTRHWWMQILIWLVIWNGIYAVTLWIVPRIVEATAGTQEVAESIDVAGQALGFFSAGALFVGIGVVMLAQGLILDEKRSGTLDFILSKPVARAAVILSKFTASSFGILISIVLAQGVIGYLQLSAYAGGAWSIPAFAGALALLGVYLLFFLALSLFLGTVFNSRGAIIGIPLVLIMGADLMLGALPQIAYVTPYGLISGAAGPESGPLAGMILLGEPVTSITPLVGTILLTVGLLAAAIWRFEREEF